MDFKIMDCLYNFKRRNFKNDIQLYFNENFLEINNFKVVNKQEPNIKGFYLFYGYGMVMVYQMVLIKSNNLIS